jgi:DNA-binding NarL/FixJ family response regulator
MHETRQRAIVLVVDDSPETLGFVTDALDAAGFMVLVATSGHATLKQLLEITPDIILMDAVMADMDGFETCRRLKTNPQFAFIPVIFMTGLSETEHIVKGFEAGGVDYLTKPIVPEELIARLRVHLANARRGHGARFALDATGRYLLSVDQAAEVRWYTPQAGRLLEAAFTGFSGHRFALPGEIGTWLRQAEATSSGADTEAVSITTGKSEARIRFSYVGTMGPDDILLRIAEADLQEELVLKSHFSLSPRESQVLLWIARGKSNRDIAAILGLSPRTVNKHLEQVFTKLGVENRTSAAAHAIHALSNR